MTADTITFVIWAGFLPVWLVWELWVIRSDERTISQVARRRAWQFTAFVYFWAAMPIHWWVPVPWEGTTAGGVAFWILQALLLAWNVAMWRRSSSPLELWPRWLRWVNWPVWYVVLGPLAAALLFPQSQMLPWSAP